MSKMSELRLQIEEMLTQGVDVSTICYRLDVPLNMVLGVYMDYDDQDDHEIINEEYIIPEKSF